MFHFSSISHVRAALFFNVLKSWNNSETLKQFVSGFYFSFISCCASCLSDLDRECGRWITVMMKSFIVLAISGYTGLSSLGYLAATLPSASHWCDEWELCHYFATGCDAPSLQPVRIPTHTSHCVPIQPASSPAAPGNIWRVPTYGSPDNAQFAVWTAIGALSGAMGTLIRACLSLLHGGVGGTPTESLNWPIYKRSVRVWPTDRQQKFCHCLSFRCCCRHHESTGCPPRFRVSRCCCNLCRTFSSRFSPRSLRLPWTLPR